jgi:hypothetical protein
MDAGVGTGLRTGRCAGATRGTAAVAMSAATTSGVMESLGMDRSIRGAQEVGKTPRARA